MNKDIIIFSKKSGVNELLPIYGKSLKGLETVFEIDRFKEHKQFAYALIDGIEIKFFTALED